MTAQIANTSPVLTARMEAVDGLRAVAALAVFTYHVWQNSDSPSLPLVAGMSLGPIIGQFHAAVDLFIVLSGFCLFWPLASSPEKLQHWRAGVYLERRWLRIAPPYYASVVFMLLLPNLLVVAYRSMGLPANWQEIPSWWQIFTHLTFTHTLFESTWGGIQGCYWTLGLEAQLYVAFAAMVPLYRRFGISIFVGVFGVSIVYRLIVDSAFEDREWTTRFLASVTFLGRWMQFGAGMLAAYLLVRLAHGRRELRRLESAALGALAIGGVACGVWTELTLPNRFQVLSSSGYGFGFASLLLLTCGSSFNIFARVVSCRPLAAFGVMSYSFYLLHQNVAFYISEGARKVAGLSGNEVFLFMMTVGLAAVGVIAFTFYWFVERPWLPPTRRVPVIALRSAPSTAAIREI